MKKILLSVFMTILLLILLIQPQLSNNTVISYIHAQTNGNVEPHGIHIAYLGSPSLGVSIVWHTFSYSESLVEYSNLNSNMTVKGITIKSNVSDVYIHKVILTNLEPGKTYFYRVGDLNRGMSKYFNFTVPAIDIDEFNFTAWGDQGVNNIAKQAVSMAVSLKPSFHLHLGDLTYSGGNEAVWNKWFDIIQPLASHVPYYLAVGNHEYEGDPQLKNFFLGRFVLPDDGANYYFIWGNVLFITVNFGPGGWYPSDNNIIQEAAKWLDETLGSFKDDFRWKILFVHYPILETPSIRNSIQPIIDKYRIDLVLSGHYHLYARSYPVRGNDYYLNEEYNYSKGLGTIYVISGGAGAFFHDLSSVNFPWIAKKAQEHHLLLVTVNKEYIEVKAISIPSGNIIDDFTILKNNGQTSSNSTQTNYEDQTTQTIIIFSIVASAVLVTALWLAFRRPL